MTTIRAAARQVTWLIIIFRACFETCFNIAVVPSSTLHPAFCFTVPFAASHPAWLHERAWIAWTEFCFGAPAHQCPLCPPPPHLPFYVRQGACDVRVQRLTRLEIGAGKCHGQSLIVALLHLPSHVQRHPHMLSASRWPSLHRPCLLSPLPSPQWRPWPP